MHPHVPVMCLWMCEFDGMWVIFQPEAFEAPWPPLCNAQGTLHLLLWLQPSRFFESGFTLYPTVPGNFRTFNSGTDYQPLLVLVLIRRRPAAAAESYRRRL